MSENRCRISVHNPSDLLGVVPYLVGYHPENQLAVLYLDADRYLIVTGTYTLKALTTDALALAAEIRDDAGRLKAASVAAVAYGPDCYRSPMTRLVSALDSGVTVEAAFLQHSGRYFCLTCPCTPLVGVPFDHAATATAARATFEGLVALPSRADLLALADPLPAEQARTAAAITAVVMPADPQPALRHLLDEAAEGARLNTEQVARLAVLLSDPDLRDFALGRTSTHVWHRDLWLDVTRRVPDGFVLHPARLAAFSAWLRGEHSVAMAAIRRVLAVDPADELALLMAVSMRAGHRAGDVLGEWPQTAQPSVDAGAAA